ncbi:MAG: AAA family ATPase [Pseudomonadota bacterium]
MKISNFSVVGQRSIRVASCDNVPPLMVVAGPNGAGKSTLLNAIRTQYGYANIMYVGPHRAMRRQHVQQRHLLTSPISMESLLAIPNLPGVEGVRISDSARDPWGQDDSASYLKHALCQIEIDRQQAITAKVDRDGYIRPGELADPWMPLRELTHSLLPHLTFERIDASSRDHVRVLWRVHGMNGEVDIDDLSSGEKSVIQMFYPLIERDIKAMIQSMGEAGGAAVRPELCLLIDEPELHLHPNLQLKVFDYLRVLTSGTGTQVILATHSPTMVEYATFEELFLLRPVELVPAEQNQLIQIATDDERLQFIRNVFGATTNLTALQPIVVVEGVAEKDASKVLPDRKLYRALHSSFDKVTIIPGGGKSECKALLRSINAAFSDYSNQLKAVALLDRDVDDGSDEELIKLLPVSMIENFLLDANSIWEAIQSVIERTGFSTVDDIESALDEVVNLYADKEIGRRAALKLGASHFYPPATLSNILPESVAYVQEVGTRYSPQAIDEAQRFAEQIVRQLAVDRRRREEFHGKEILNEFYRLYLHKTGLSKVVFTFEVARYSKRRRSVTSFFEGFFGNIGIQG